MKRKLQQLKTRIAGTTCDEEDKKSSEVSQSGVDKRPQTVSETTDKQSCDLGTTSSTRSSTGNFSGMLTSDLLFVEVFAGTARLCKATKELGMEVLPVDKTSARASQIYIAQYDVTDPEQLENFMEVLHVERHRIVAVHLAPACSTASKAREKKLVSWAKKGFKIPKPLRSAQKPMGVDGLEGLDKIRTEAANQTYAATARIVRFCVLYDILCSVENPENSLFWLFPDMVEAMLAAEGYSISFHNCMHGGKRKKLTKWWSTKDVFTELQSLCDGKHHHAQWNPVQQGTALQFPTAEEAAYPHLLCKRIAAILLKYAISKGAVQVDTLEKQVAATVSTSHRWMDFGSATKGQKTETFGQRISRLLFFPCQPIAGTRI